METKRLNNEKRLYKRLIISRWDLSKALEFIEIILNKNLIGSKKKDEKSICTALSIAIIVTYWKPFSGNRNRLDVKPSLPKKSIKAFNDIELILHERIKRIRNNEFAHSAPGSHDLDVFINKMNNEKIFIPAGRNVYIPMEKNDILNLKEMILKILKWISTEIKRIQNVAEVNKNF